VSLPEWKPVRNVAWTDWFVYLAVRTLLAIVQALPLDVCERLARGLAWVLTDLLRVRDGVLRENLEIAFPKASEARRRAIRRGMWEHLLLMGCEAAHAPRKIHDTNWRDYVRLEGARPLVEALLSRRPVLVVSAHWGNFELAGFVLGLLGFPTYTVARTLDNPYLDRFVNRFRGATGQHIIAKKGGYEPIERVLARGGAMTFLADQYAGSRGCWVDFFGRPASTHNAIALFALHHDAPLFVGGARRMGSPLRYQLAVTDCADPRSNAPAVQSIRALTQWYTSCLERMIASHPEQYWWLHRRWKDGRPVRGARSRAA
jgi:Kdo2-lipid IVA lauroyltransferase/acyltransferase